VHLHAIVLTLLLLLLIILFQACFTGVIWQPVIINAVQIKHSKNKASSTKKNTKVKIRIIKKRQTQTLRQLHAKTIMQAVVCPHTYEKGTLCVTGT